MENALYQREIEEVAQMHRDLDANVKKRFVEVLTDLEKSNECKALVLGSLLKGAVSVLGTPFPGQNCRVARFYPAPRALHPGGLRYHWKETPDGPQVKDCRPGEACDPCGHGSIEWCGECLKVV